MSQRRFGPTLGAGVAVLELPADKLLEAAPLGVTLYVGILEKGDTNTLISTASPKDMQRKIGFPIAESQCPDAAADFWVHSAGAGELHFLRVTDGTERQAQVTLYSRESFRNPVVQLQAHNGGRWAGRWQALVGDVTGSSDITNTTLATGKTLKTDEFKDAKLVLDGVSGKVYTVIGNSSAGLITVKSDSTMKADYVAISASDTGYQLVLDRDLTGGPNDGPRELTYEVGDGDVDAANNWSLKVYVNGSPTKRWGDLSMDPTSKYYFVNLINDDLSNFDVLATDLNAPASATADKRPANHSETTASVTTFGLVSQLMQLRVTLSPGNANPIVAVGTTSDLMKYRDRIECTMTSTTAFTAKSLDLGAGGSQGGGVIGTLFTPASPLLPPFTITNGTTVVASGDKFVVEYFPMVPGDLVGGLIYPDIAGAPLKAYRITDNDHKSVTIANGDLTVEGAASKRFKVVYQQPLGGAGTIGGYDGLANIVDADYITPHLDPNASKALGLFGQNKGLVKVATPGVTSTAVQKAGASFAEANNWQFRYEFPDTVVDEAAAISFINDTIGRSDMAVVELPSYVDVDDPKKPGQLKRQTATGMIHGREALVAKNYDGYHKAAAGIDVTLPAVLRLPVEGLNEEMLNPAGINVLKKNKGNVIIWGDRTVSVDPAWQFKHQREYFSHIENRLRDSFDYIIFAINDPVEQAKLVTTLRAMFQDELGKRAIRGKDLGDAVSIKVDGDINTDATRAAGDLNCQIKIRGADTIERMVFQVGKAGIFESLE